MYSAWGTGTIRNILFYNVTLYTKKINITHPPFITTYFFFLLIFIVLLQCSESCYPCCAVPEQLAGGEEDNTIFDSDRLEEGVCDYFHSGTCLRITELQYIASINDYKNLYNIRANSSPPFSGCNQSNVFEPSYIYIIPRR